MSKQLCPVDFGQSDDNSICTTNKRKKLSLSKELLRESTQFKRMLISQNENYEISFLDPVNGEQLKLMCTDTLCTGRVLHAGVRTLQSAIDRERSHRREYVDGLMRYMRELNRLDEAKEVLLEGLERMRAGVDGTVDALRVDVERAHCQYEERKKRFFRFTGGAEESESQEMIATDRGFRSLCLDEAVGDVSLPAAACWSCDIDADDDGGWLNDVDADDDADVALTIFRRLRRDAEARSGGDGCRLRIDELLTLWRAIKSVSEYNRTLETIASELDEQTDSLQTSLCSATAACTALDADQSDKKCRAVVLDDFCAVTEQITAQQIRNLEFGRMLAVDEKQIGEELEKIGQLKAKVARKKEKKQKLLEQTDSVKSQLEVYKSRYEELKRKRALLDDNLNMTKRSPSKLANQSEQQGFGQRVKHLEQLKNQYNKLANKRDALKLKIQSQQQVVKTPRRINTFCNT
ncbi:uncharacterized protein LOC100569299 [Acyrthosiphon pisum]|uniref:Uncharacterized protein n=1 Tax=Acyrthosiphon pisum TaxID=7029 RepID=A0A8R2B2Y5_ACYPI|nr:uncharacterized protein LOC100569299 [Acyrthosiphon pisum]XP_016657872.1 uncharacterized protein LOC100569299 [Acyrthosiphon pisum]|eukprot:XP_008180545.1 PREDICTED: uncharacterized protein LOC100569299 [Acyrthosiphon pisum]